MNFGSKISGIGSWLIGKQPTAAVPAVNNTPGSANFAQKVEAMAQTYAGQITTPAGIDWAAVARNMMDDAWAMVYDANYNPSRQAYYGRTTPDGYDLAESVAAHRLAISSSIEEDVRNPDSFPPIAVTAVGPVPSFFLDRNFRDKALDFSRAKADFAYQSAPGSKGDQYKDAFYNYARAKVAQGLEQTRGDKKFPSGNIGPFVDSLFVQNPKTYYQNMVLLLDIINNNLVSPYSIIKILEAADYHGKKRGDQRIANAVALAMTNHPAFLAAQGFNQAALTDLTTIANGHLAAQIKQGGAAATPPVPPAAAGLVAPGLPALPVMPPAIPAVAAANYANSGYDPGIFAPSGNLRGLADKWESEKLIEAGKDARPLTGRDQYEFGRITGGLSLFEDMLFGIIRPSRVWQLLTDPQYKNVQGPSVRQAIVSNLKNFDKGLGGMFGG